MTIVIVMSAVNCFKAKTGQDPLELKYPMENQSWINFRLDAITRVVDAITKAVKADHKAISAQCSRDRPCSQDGAPRLGRMDAGCLLSDDL